MFKKDAFDVAFALSPLPRTSEINSSFLFHHCYLPSHPIGTLSPPNSHPRLTPYQQLRNSGLPVLLALPFLLPSSFLVPCSLFLAPSLLCENPMHYNPFTCV